MDMQTLGDYTLVKQIGHGSLGIAYLAEHRFMKNRCVLKVLPEELASDPEFIERFEEDVKALSTLNHPNIVQIHNISYAQGLYFLVADCIVDPLGKTTNLAEYATSLENRLSEDELVRLLRKLASALDYAHGVRGSIPMVHRGIKLNNILVGSNKDGVDLFLSDFGLSRIIGPGAVLTRTYKMVAEALALSSANRYLPPGGDCHQLSLLHHSFLQNFAFLAPEQRIHQERTSVDIRADNYAFGVLVYFLITGRYPELILEPVSSYAPEYKLNWDQLLTQCLQSNPEKRAFFLEPLLDQLLENKQSSDRLEIFEQEKEMSFSNSMTNESSLSEPAPHKAENFSVGERIQERIRSELTVTQYRPEVREDRQIEPLLSEGVMIPGGKFWRGSNQGSRDEMPPHFILVDSFALDCHPVTNEQFVRFLEAVGDEKDNQNHDLISIRESRIKRISGKLTIESGYARHPVIGVTWYGAVAYAKWIGKRLPTEAEWEVAAKGDLSGALYPTGEEIEKSQANFFSSDTTPVMSYAPNAYGLYDMAGNVYEWCQDWYDYNYYEHSSQEPSNPKGPLQGVYRVLRGGCWKSLKDDLRCSHRHRNNPGIGNRTYGFRCASNIAK